MTPCVRESQSDQSWLVEDRRIITLQNTLVRKHVCKGTARANGGDFGDMHAMGTHVPRDGEGLQVLNMLQTQSFHGDSFASL
jgi:hypothetical protein